tara:strand:+ start:753 stop:1367 length:615 start_codon:yes stop_codon:yes gene_type:complete
MSRNRPFGGVLAGTDRPVTDEADHSKRNKDVLKMELRTVIKSKKLENDGPTILLMKDSKFYYLSGSPTGDHTISADSSEERVEAHWQGYKVAAEDEWLDRLVPDAVRESTKRFSDEAKTLSPGEAVICIDERPTLDLPEFIYRQATKAAAAVHSRYIQDGWDEEDIYVTDQNGYTRYSEEAQEIFNDYYDRAEEILLLHFKKGA